MSLFYKQTSADGCVRIERCTENVPDDGYYHLIQNDSIVSSTHSIKKAQREFNRLKPKINQKQTHKDSKKIIAKELIEQTASAKEIYWHYSSNYRSGRPKR